MLHSELLLNAVAQSARQPAAATPDLLSRPIAERKLQLGLPIAQLQRKAQTALLGASTIALVGPSTCYVAWVAEAVTSSTGVALGVASAALAAWTLQRSWAKAQRRFLAHVDRVLAGLGHDVEVRGENVVGCR